MNKKIVEQFRRTKTIEIAINNLIKRLPSQCSDASTIKVFGFFFYS